MRPAPTGRGAEFQWVRAGHWWCRVHPRIAAVPLTAAPDALSPIDGCMRDQQPVPASPMAAVTRGYLVCGDLRVAVFSKRFFARSRLDWLKQQLMRSRAERAFAADQMLKREGFVTAETLVTGWRQRWLHRSGFFTVTAELDGYATLYRHLELLAQAPRAKRQLLATLATRVAALHGRGIAHGDLRLGNIMARDNAGEWQFAFLDNERTRRYARLPTRLRVKNLVQLNMLTGPLITSRDRLRFFQAYCAGGGGDLNPSVLRQRVAARTRVRLQRLVARGRLAAADVWL